MGNRKFRDLDSIVLIASKYDLDPKQLVDAFSQALENGICQLGSLEISRRAVNQNTASLLITKEKKIVSQFSVDLEMITNPNVRDYIKKIAMPEKIVKTDTTGRKLKISELMFGMKGVNVTAEIIKIPPVKRVDTKWGSEAFVSNARVVDETGSIMLSLWNNQIDMVHVGDEVELKNCNVARFIDELQLRLGRKGTMSVLNQLQRKTSV